MLTVCAAPIARAELMLQIALWESETSKNGATPSRPRSRSGRAGKTYVVLVWRGRTGRTDSDSDS